MRIEILIEGPLHAIKTLHGLLERFSPTLRGSSDGRASIIITETEEGVDQSLFIISQRVSKLEKDLHLTEGLEFRVRNLAYSEPEPQGEAWKDAFCPVNSLLIQPWYGSMPEIADAPSIIIDQQHAFGTGLHPTTQLCLKALEEMGQGQEPLHGKDVLDFGCGTGLLALAAVKLGARGAVGVEIDPDSAATARKNVRLNKFCDRVSILEGSWEGVRGTFDLVLANLVPSVLYRTGREIPCHLKEKGRVVVAGFGEKETRNMENFFSSLGLKVIRRSSLGGWGALTLHRLS